MNQKFYFKDVNLKKRLKNTILKAILVLSGPALLASFFDAALLGGIRFFVEIISKNSILSIGEWSLIMVLVVCLRFIFLRAKFSTAQKLFRQLESSLQGSFLSILRHLNPRFFHHKNSDSKVQAAFEATRTLSVSGEALMQTLQAFLQLLVFLPVLLYLSWPLTLLLLVVVLPVLTYTQKKWRHIGPLIENQMNVEASFRSELEKVKKIYRFWSSAWEKSAETHHLIDKIRQVRRISIEAGIRQASLFFLMEAVSIIAMVGILTFCGWMIAHSWMEPKDLILYCSAVFLCYKPIKECVRIAPQMRAAKSAYNILNRFSQEPRQRRELKTKGSQLEIKNAHFMYEGATKPVFKAFSLSWQSHQPVLLTGPNGVGKSTLLRLIAGLEEWESGEMTYPSLFTKAGAFFIAQDIILPPLYLLEFIIQQSDDPHLKTFVEQAHVSHLLKNDSFSGGEKARLALIWALASKSQLLLLDEPFAYISRLDKDFLLDAFLNTASKMNKWVILSSHEKMESRMLMRFQEVTVHYE